MIEMIFLFMETISIMIFYVTLNKNGQYESFFILSSGKVYCEIHSLKCCLLYTSPSPRDRG